MINQKTNEQHRYCVGNQNQMIYQGWTLGMNDNGTRVGDKIVYRIDVQHFLTLFRKRSIIPEYSTAEIKQSTENRVEVLHIFKENI